MMRRRQHRSTGQALVEFALAATLLFFLVSAAVDLGLIFFSVQALRVGAQEGATFGSYPVEYCGSQRCLNSSSAVSEVVLDYDQIIRRIRTSVGDPSRGIVDFADLNNNGVDDVVEGIVPNPNTDRRTPVTSGPIQITNPFGSDPGNLGRDCRTTVPRVEMRNGGASCWVHVRLVYTYRFYFPLAPAFGRTVDIPIRYTLQVRGNCFC